MRIVAGRWRGRKIDTPTGSDVRPTLDSVREAWMNILQFRIPDAAVLDLYAGSGALGLEALSRGARSADFVEKNRRVLLTLRKNVVLLDATSVATIHLADSLHFAAALAVDAYDVAFADPPYESGAAAAVAATWQSTRFARVLSIEHAIGENMPGTGDTRRYGSTAITIYRSED